METINKIVEKIHKEIFCEINPMIADLILSNVSFDEILGKINFNAGLNSGERTLL